jgi:very-short-patch-repair endonuclease
MMTANSIAELADQIRRAPTPIGAKRLAEFSALRSFAFAPLFTKIFGSDDFCCLEEGSDPPDYCLTTPTAKVGIEITSITTPRLKIFRRVRSRTGSYTSMLRSKKSKPDARFWNKLRNNELQDDSEAVPHFEKVGDLDRDYYEIAHNLMKIKMERLTEYRPKYWKNVLLVHDELSKFKSDFERRIPILRGVLNFFPTRLRFDAIVLVDGNHHFGVKAYRL